MMFLDGHNDGDDLVTVYFRVYLLRIQLKQRTFSDFDKKQPKHQNRNFLKTFCKHLR